MATTSICSVTFKRRKRGRLENGFGFHDGNTIVTIVDVDLKPVFYPEEFHVQHDFSIPVTIKKRFA